MPRRTCAERPEHTLQPTALVNEAYAADQRPQRTVGITAPIFWDRRASDAQILVDHARKQRAGKRGMATRTNRPLSQVADPSGGQNFDVVALHEALDDLAALILRQAEIVELKVFRRLD